MRLIDADKLVNSLENDLQSFEEMISEHGKGLAHGTRIALNRIAEQPTISPESLRPQWIPVKERLPECGEHYESNDVLVSVDYRPDDPEETKDTFVSIDHVCFNCFEQGGFSIERDNPYDTEPSPYFVTHWLPLPEPYNADAEENEGVQPAHWEKADIPLPYQIRTVPTPSGTFAHREMYVCSACDGYNDKNTQYCPHCGARMDRKDGNG